MVRGEARLAEALGVEIEQIIALANDFTRTSPLNRMAALGGLRLFEPPLVGVATADDPMFARLKAPEAVGPHHLLPAEWLAGGKSVLSWFLPFTAAVREANRESDLPALEWLYGRIEGQVFVNALTANLIEALAQGGHRALAPSLDPRFAVVSRRSNWSERHVAFIAGLGTFSLSRSIITRAGSAGRLGSVIVDFELEATPRPYQDLNENCSECLSCIPRCPPQAISEAGKDHGPCSAYLDEMKIRFDPRYGCGKCQTGVPCEDRIPGR